MKTLINKSIISALSFLFVIAFSPMINAAENPFGMSNTAHMQLADSHNEGKCGDSKKEREKGDNKEGKCGKGKCGDGMKMKSDEGKCGNGKKREPEEPKCGASE